MSASLTASMERTTGIGGVVAELVAAGGYIMVNCLSMRGLPMAALPLQFWRDALFWVLGAKVTPTRLHGEKADRLH